MSTKYIVNNISGQTINGQPIDPKYKECIVLIDQTDTDNPTVLEISNTVGLSLSFTRQGVGSYQALFPSESINLTKSVILCSSPGLNNYGPYLFTIPSVRFASAGPNTAVTIFLNLIESDGSLTPIELSDVPTPFYLEIREYN